MLSDNQIQNHSRRTSDYRGEKALGLFLDENLYSKMKEDGRIISFERMYTKKEQLKGCDVEVYFSNGVLTIDEKAQLYYINHPKDTFALEIDYISPETGCCVNGWFIDDQNRTDGYLFVWIKKAKESRLERIVSHDFLDIEAYLVGKNKIREWLTNNGLDVKCIKQIAEEMRKFNEYERVMNEDIKFIKSDIQKYVEEPVNIVISKEILSMLAAAKYAINKSGYQIID